MNVIESARVRDDGLEDGDSEVGAPGSESKQNGSEGLELS